jgi:protein O-GlcNAc transferase
MKVELTERVLQIVEDYGLISGIATSLLVAIFAFFFGRKKSLSLIGENNFQVNGSIKNSNFNIQHTLTDEQVKFISTSIINDITPQICTSIKVEIEKQYQEKELQSSLRELSERRAVDEKYISVIDLLVKLDFESACSELEQIAKRGDDFSAKAWNILGNMYYFKNTEKSVEAYLMSIEADNAQFSSKNSLGLLYLREGEYSKAFQIFNELKNLTGIILKNRISASGNLGLVQEAQGKYGDAILSFMYALELAKDNPDHDNSRMLQYGNLGNIYSSRGELQLARDNYEKSLSMANHSGNRKIDIHQLNNLGTILMKQGELQQAKNIFTEALHKAEELKYVFATSNIYGNLGQVYEMWDEYEQSMTYYRKSIEINEKFGHRLGVSNQLGNIGLLLQVQGNNIEALEYFRRALAIAEDIGNKAAIIRQLNNVGLGFQLQNEIETARQYYERSLTVSKEIGSQSGIASSLASIGGFHQEKGETKQAIIAYKKALVYFDYIRNVERSAQLYCNLGILFKHEPVKSLRYYTKALDQIQGRGFRRVEAKIRVNLGVLFQGEGQLDEAISEYRHSLTISSQLEHTQEEAICYYNLATAFERLGNPKEELKMLNLCLAKYEACGQEAMVEKVRQKIDQKQE